MAIVKIFMSVVIFLFSINSAESNPVRNKYNPAFYNLADTNVNIRDALEYAYGILKAEVTKAEKKFKKDIPIWKLEMLTDSGGTLVIEVSCIDKSLIRLDASEGPFEYEIVPNANLVSYSSAKKIAEEYTGQKTLKWSLLLSRGKWEYNFWLFVKSGKAQVKIDAETGEIITKKKKK